jgi:hypothetical protein
MYINSNISYTCFISWSKIFFGKCACEGIRSYDQSYFLLTPATIFPGFAPDAGGRHRRGMGRSIDHIRPATGRAYRAAWARARQMWPLQVREETAFDGYRIVGSRAVPTSYIYLGTRHGASAGTRRRAVAAPSPPYVKQTSFWYSGNYGACFLNLFEIDIL